MKILKNKGLQSLIASLICIALGILIGYIVLLVINPAGASGGISNLLKNFFNYPKEKQMEYFAKTLVKTAPLIMCSLAVLFAYKTGLFNIGAAGQYCMGICACLFCGLYLKLSWPICLLAAILAGAIMGSLVGVLKSFCNVNEVISGIMLNWISLYVTNIVLKLVKKPSTTETLETLNVSNSLLPRMGKGITDFFGGCKYLTVAVPAAIIIAVVIWIVLEKTRFGYELKATGFNKNAARYSGMAEKRNAILTLVIAGALAGAGASFYYQTGISPWYYPSSVPSMGFNGIAAAFLGGLNPIGTIFASFFLQHITEGGSMLNTNYYSAQISDLISSVIIYLCGFVLFIKYMMNKVGAGRERAPIALNDTGKAAGNNKPADGAADAKGGDK